MPTIALVTGASSGLGRAFVRLLDQSPRWHLDEIWAVARRAEGLDALVRTTGTTVRPFCLDLTDPDAYAILESALDESQVTCTLLINNAGAGTFGAFSHQPPGSAGGMIDLLARAPVEPIYRTLPHMTAGSRIINVSSVAAFIPQPDLAVYSAAKRFVLDVSRALDAELGAVDIHVTALCPKFMRTAFLDHPGDSAAERRMEEALGFEDTGRVAAKALAAARAGRSLCIPSFDMKLLHAATKIAPYRTVLGIERALGVIV